MKIRKPITPSIVLSGCLILALAMSGCGKRQSSEFEPERWANMQEEQLTRNLENYFSSGELPEGEEKAFIIWAFEKDPDKAEGYIRQYANEVPNLPWYLSDGAWDLVRQRKMETSGRMLNLARELYPNNPDVLGITGVIAYLQGETAIARQLLEEAETWRRNRPIVDFYLGGLLVQSESAADRSRGKAILMELVDGSDSELRELAGLTVLTNMNVPLIRQDLEKLYTILEGDSVFRLENDNLPAEALRVMINRLANIFPERAMNLTELLLQYPDTNVEDLMGAIQIAQILGRAEDSSAYLEQLEADVDFMEQLGADPRLPRIKAIQPFKEEAYDRGVEALSLLLEDSGQAAALQQTFKIILMSDLPISAEEEVLRLYLELPVQSVPDSVGIVNRLINIAPLEKDQWTAYAIESLLGKNPILVGSWLVEIDASKSVIAALEGSTTQLTPDKAIVLINAYIEETLTDKAESTLSATKGLIDPVMEAYLRARVLLQKGELEEALVYWDEAHQGVLGSNRFPLMKNLGILALQLGQPVHAMQSLYTAFSAGIPFNQAQASKLIELTLEYGNLRQSIRIAEYLANRNPDSPLHHNNLAYFRFLAEEAIEESVERMRQLVDEYPDVPQFKLTLALGLVKAGRNNEANRLLKTTDIDWSKTSTRGLLIYAVVLAASDQRTVAEGLLQNLDLDILIPEEKALLEAF
ncbi:MAG: hypothetical protein AB3N33_11435 [Puniceicoccaceae bacterium]